MYMKYCTVVVEERKYFLKVFCITNDKEDSLCENTTNYILLGDVFFKKNKSQLELQSYGNTYLQKKNCEFFFFNFCSFLLFFWKKS